MFGAVKCLKSWLGLVCAAPPALRSQSDCGVEVVWDYGCTQSRPGAATAATQWRCARDATAGAKITAEPTDAAAEPPAIGVLWPEHEKRAIWQGLMEWLGPNLV